MRIKFLIVAAGAIVAGLSLPAAADINAGKLTCDQFMAMGPNGQIEARNALTIFVNDSANVDVAAAAAAIIAGLSDADLNSRIDAACVDSKMSETVVSVLQ